MAHRWHRGIVRVINAITLPEEGSVISGGGEGTRFVAHEVWTNMCSVTVPALPLPGPQHQGLWSPPKADEGTLISTTVSTTLTQGGLPPTLLLMLFLFFHQEHG